MLALAGTLTAISPAALAAPPPSLTARQTAVPGTPLFPRAPRPTLRLIAVKAPGVAVRRSGDTLRLSLKQPSNTMTVFSGQRSRAVRTTGTSRLPRYWMGVLGPRPTVALDYTISGVKRTHVLRGGVLPRYRNGQLQVQFRATDQNLAVLSRMRRSGASNVQARLLPTPVAYGPFKAGAYDPGVAHKSETQTSTSGTFDPYPAPAPNASFTLPYVSTLGSGGQSWVSYLSATGETTNSCLIFGAPTSSAGDPQENAGIFVYQTSSEVQQALNVGGSIAYSSHPVSASLSAGYTGSAAQSSTSVYAVAFVNYQSGVSTLGSPTLQGTYATDAAEVSNLTGALQLMQRCGDSYPTGYNVGAAWVSVLEIKTSSTSQAQSLAASLQASYKGVNAAADFSAAVESSTSTGQLLETDECWGPTSCGTIPGYGAPAGGATINAALQQFTNNYTAMYNGLPTACVPSSTTSSCIISVNYSPLAQLPNMPLTAANYLQQASESTFGVSQNLNAWNAEYQSLVTGTPTAPDAATNPPGAWTTATANTADQGQACSLANLSSNSACVNRDQSCLNSLQRTYSYLNSECLPSAFTTNDLYELANPFLIAGEPEANLAD